MRIIITAGALLLAASAPAATEDIIWFDAPATNFLSSCPLGNGRLGAMMFGGVSEERVVLNESSVWSGSRQESDRPDAAQALPEIRRLLLEGRNDEAEALINARFTCKGPGSEGAAYGCYQVLGNLHLAFDGFDTNEPVTDYRRELSLDTAMATVRFKRGGVTYSREMFASAPDQAIVVRLSADQAGKISFHTTLDRPERFDTAAVGTNSLLMTGQLDNGTNGKGIRYAARVRVVAPNGQVSAAGNRVLVRNADSALLYITAATDYRDFAGRQIKNPAAGSLSDLNAAARRPYGDLAARHVTDYRKYFHRVRLDLGDPAEARNLPTPARIEALKAGADDPGLAALYFNFGRYLLISSSRPGGLPANLQGIWAEELKTPWNGDWHLDVNVQMNYWPAEACNLSELTGPLFALIDSLREPGARTARRYYGAGGWVAHVITNPWGFTSPGEGASWGTTPGGSAWLCQHLYDHYLFTLDGDFLRRAYPIMKGAARFYADTLIEDPRHHWLVVAPANSPENHFRMANGRESSIAAGTTYDSQLLRYLFTACIESSKILVTDDAFRRELTEKRARLAPTQIGSDGRIMEWLEEYQEVEPHHRHMAHLWGLYPGDEISPDKTPALASAARKSLEARGEDSLGWSFAYKVALWARLGDGDHAWKLIRGALSPAKSDEIRYDAGGGVYPNLFDACPPFQIDGNFGTTAAIAEMLVQSGDGVIKLLPALPGAWKQGAVSGLRARGAFTVDIAWKDGRLETATIHADKAGPCRVSYGGKTADFRIAPGGRVTLNGQLKAP
jgi:alpha-L-fucosidase 2